MTNTMGKFLLFVFIPLLSLFFSGCNLNQSQSQSQSQTQNLSPSPELQTSSQSSPQPEITPEETNSDEQAIVDMLVKVAPVTAGQLSANVIYNRGNFAFGSLEHTYPQTVEGIYWIVKKINIDWELIYYGQLNQECSLLTDITLPEELLTVCNNLSQNITN